jgi:preprotein translocase subunit SecE
MPKRDKEARKRAQRRERAKGRSQGELAFEGMEGIEGGTETAVVDLKAAQAAPTPPRDKKAAPPVEIEEPLTFTERVEDFFGPMTDFLKEVRIEAKKINWPAREDAWRSTMVVVFTIVFLALFMGAFGYVFQEVGKVMFRGGQTGMTQTGGAGPVSPTDTTGIPVPTGEPTTPLSPAPTGTGGGTPPPSSPATQPPTGGN